MKNAATSQDSPVAALIAPCGLNCDACRAHLRNRNSCPGCRAGDRGKPKTRVACKIKLCEERRRTDGNFCGECSSFPCEPLRRLDNRYRAKYGVSAIENLQNIKTHGLAQFVEQERYKWTCVECGAQLCMHETSCPSCNCQWRLGLSPEI